MEFKLSEAGLDAQRKRHDRALAFTRAMRVLRTERRADDLALFHRADDRAKAILQAVNRRARVIRAARP